MPGDMSGAFKIRRVLDVIRGKSYECLIMLEFMPYRSRTISTRCSRARPTPRTNMGMNKAKLYASEATDAATTMKRFRPRAQGRPFSIRKRHASP